MVKHKKGGYGTVSTISNYRNNINDTNSLSVSLQKDKIHKLTSEVEKEFKKKIKEVDKFNKKIYTYNELLNYFNELIMVYKLKKC
jgi:hypothetical protein